ncbi:Uncharacterised protein [Delftia tsuruhatensis]|uniref:hypothetical protein n=1 Tax=Delftia tsuruhatensis TaxID=180282 RepID=UPI001E716F8E|nr:hypothetical protein [Delftia tsuruhatensis]CAB5711724.1 Uncharacterised protein [Delftia tsuruhatensis]CAC9686914.1 Uncharacterised protein [Delftia tsuruhatensis]
MRHAHLLAPLGLAALLATSPPIHAQARDGQASPPTPTVPQPSALDPSAPRLPLRHTALAPSGAVSQEWADWREANAAVAEFPRGHVDILRWEAGQAGPSVPPPPAHGTHGAHGGKP